MRKEMDFQVWPSVHSVLGRGYLDSPSPAKNDIVAAAGLRHASSKGVSATALNNVSQESEKRIKSVGLETSEDVWEVWLWDTKSFKLGRTWIVPKILQNHVGLPYAFI